MPAKTFVKYTCDLCHATYEVELLQQYARFPLPSAWVEIDVSYTDQAGGNDGRMAQICGKCLNKIQDEKDKKGDK